MKGERHEKGREGKGREKRTKKEKEQNQGREEPPPKKIEILKIMGILIN